MLTEESDPIISRILTEPSDIPEEKRTKAVRECVLRIKENFLKTSIDDLVTRLKHSEGESAQQELRDAFVEKSKQLKKLMEELKEVKKMA